MQYLWRTIQQLLFLPIDPLWSARCKNELVWRLWGSCCELNACWLIPVCIRWSWISFEADVIQSNDTVKLSLSHADWLLVCFSPVWAVIDGTTCQLSVVSFWAFHTVVAAQWLSTETTIIQLLSCISIVTAILRIYFYVHAEFNRRKFWHSFIVSERWFYG